MGGYWELYPLGLFSSWYANQMDGQLGTECVQMKYVVTNPETFGSVRYLPGEIKMKQEVFLFLKSVPW